MSNTAAINPTSVTVAVPARLHLGFLDLNGSLGRRFGSIGLAVSGFGTKITIRKASRTKVAGPDSVRAARHLAAVQSYLGITGEHELNIEQAVPSHAGLGSGTQIALAVAAGVRSLHNLSLDAQGDALRLGRGHRSGVGIGLFEQGGLVVDGGRGATTSAPPIVARLRFPESWRVLLLLDPARSGVHGVEENAAFTDLPPFPDQLAGHICRLVLMKALPAAAEHDLASFGAAVKDVQAIVGDYFAPLQGGDRYASPDVAAGLAFLDRAGAFGIGQSSWGPTGFAFAESAEQAEPLARHVREQSKSLDIRICEGLNRGASIDVRAGAEASS